MLEFLIVLDRKLFLLINTLPHSPLLDALGLLCSFLGAFGLVWYVLALVIYIGEKKKDHTFLGTMFLVGLLAIFFISTFKPFFHRDRPDVAIGARVVLVASDFFLETLNDAYAFPSGHATIAFAAAYILARKRKKWSEAFYLLAAIIAFTRIYLGKHYPVDVFVGMLLGLGIGLTVFTVSGKKGFRSG